MVKIITFEEALNESAKNSKRHLLLGNGFSIACKPDIFQYGKLFDRADFSNFSPAVKKTFQSMATEDFEKIIKSLQDASKVLEAYNHEDKDLIKNLRSDSETLKELLVNTLAASHPANPSQLSESQYTHCKIFLKNFNRVYTLNYDLLLYWVCMHCEDDEEPLSDDGFRKPHNNYDAPYVTWEPNNAREQNMFFLHGALHLFDAGYELRKFTWVNTSVRLIEQIREAMNLNLFPVFVSEGTSKEKIEKIRHNDYLAKSFRSFSEIGGALFIYGHSLAENDEHFFTCIENGKIRQLYIGVYGDPATPENLRIIRRANRMALNRKKKNLEVFFYDVSTANVWS